jgi:hypothetical protein
VRFEEAKDGYRATGRNGGLGMRTVQTSCLNRLNKTAVFLLLTALVLWCLTLVGCGAPFTPAVVCETPNATFNLQQGVTRTCAFYTDALTSAWDWDVASGFFSGSPSHLNVYVYATDIFDGIYEGRWTPFTHDMELGQSAGALAHELLHVIHGELHHEGWGYLGAIPGATVYETMISPDTGQPIQILYTSYYQRTIEWNQLWLANPNESDSNAMTVGPKSE